MGCFFRNGGRGLRGPGRASVLGHYVHTQMARCLLAIRMLTKLRKCLVSGVVEAFSPTFDASFCTTCPETAYLNVAAFLAGGSNACFLSDLSGLGT
jgi:hypothetical protein